MGIIVDLTGFETEHLKVLGKSGHKIYKNGRKKVQWNCICKHCGKEFQDITGRIKNNYVNGCGCQTFELKSKVHTKHGLYGTRIYSIWSGMVRRCFNKNAVNYPDYGGRGITVCDEWLGENGAENFAKWAYDNGYNENAKRSECTLDRKNVNGNYEPTNCRWINMKEQERNRTNNVIIEINGMKKTLIEWCEIYNMNYKLVYGRIFKNKWEPKIALTKKKRKRRN